MLRSKDTNHHNKTYDGADNADKDYVPCLSSIFPNADNNLVEFVYYIKDAAGRVASMDTCSKETLM
jgi:uncharacterized pyridoxamine 5'-phosphate oxidase family protein